MPVFCSLSCTACRWLARQTDATFVNIFWPWDQLLMLAGGPDKPPQDGTAGLIEQGQAGGGPLLSGSANCLRKEVILLSALCSGNNTPSTLPLAACALQVAHSSLV